MATAVVNLFFGTLIAKFGAKKLVVAGLFCVAFSMFLYSIADGLPLIYVAGTLLGIGFAWTSTTMVGYIGFIYDKK